MVLVIDDATLADFICSLVAVYTGQIYWISNRKTETEEGKETQTDTHRHTHTHAHTHTHTHT